jgi:hypothetical protein
MMQIEYRSTLDLNPLHNNPRYISEDSLETLSESIQNNKSYFEARPLILSDRTGLLVIIAGNMRFRAATAIGMKMVPTVLISGLSEQEEAEIIIRDNVNNGKWDYDMLANEFSDFELSDWGLSIPDLTPIKSTIDEEGKGDESNVDSVNAPDISLSIVFDDLQVYDTVKLEVEELLKGYPGASLKE